MTKLYTTKLTYGPAGESALKNPDAELTRLRAEREELVAALRELLAATSHLQNPNSEVRRGDAKVAARALLAKLGEGGK